MPSAKHRKLAAMEYAASLFAADPSATLHEVGAALSNTHHHTLYYHELSRLRNEARARIACAPAVQVAAVTIKAMPQAVAAPEPVPVVEPAPEVNQPAVEAVEMTAAEEPAEMNAPIAHAVHHVVTPKKKRTHKSVSHPERYGMPKSVATARKKEKYDWMRLYLDREVQLGNAHVTGKELQAAVRRHFKEGVDAYVVSVLCKEYRTKYHNDCMARKVAAGPNGVIAISSKIRESVEYLTQLVEMPPFTSPATRWVQDEKNAQRAEAKRAATGTPKPPPPMIASVEVMPTPAATKAGLSSSINIALTALSGAAKKAGYKTFYVLIDEDGAVTADGTK